MFHYKVSTKSTSLTYFSKPEKVKGGVYAGKRQAHIVLLFFQYFSDLSFLIILGGLWVPTVVDSQPI